MVMPRRFSSSSRFASMPVNAFTSAVFPWSIWPAVPTMMFFMLVSILLSGPVRAQPTGFRAGITLVKVDAAVTDRGGRPIPGLTMRDFALYDENAQERIVYFEQEADPLDLLLLLDVSGSM